MSPFDTNREKRVNYQPKRHFSQQANLVRECSECNKIEEKSGKFKKMLDRFFVLRSPINK